MSEQVSAWLKRSPVLPLAVLSVSALIASCANLQEPGPVLVTLPALEASAAATLNFSSKPNPSPIKHHHVVILDGQKIARMDESDTASFLVGPGTHTLELSCHTRNTLDDSGFPVNYNVSDADATLDIDVAAGTELCLSVGYETFNCAVLEEAEPEACQ